jgi:DNA-binding transcriptional MerR regulator
MTTTTATSDEPVVTVSVAARRAHVSEGTIKAWFDRGEITGKRGPTGRRLIHPASLEKRTNSVSVAEAAGLAHCCEQTIRLWFDSGRIVGYRTPAGYRRIDTGSLHAYLTTR